MLTFFMYILKAVKTLNICSFKLCLTLISKGVLNKQLLTIIRIFNELYYFGIADLFIVENLFSNNRLTVLNNIYSPPK